jgi:anti-sigma regulatory factor (Ser/Thr protein kinase)
MMADPELAEQIELVATPTAPGCARAFVAATLRQWELTHLNDDATLVGSELVTNALHATGVVDPPSYPALERRERLARIWVQLLVYPRSLVVEVWDESPDRPEAREADSSSEDGRGLFLVQALSERWGVWSPGFGWKVVFAELARDKAAPRPQQSSKRVTPEPRSGDGSPLPKRVRPEPRSGVGSPSPKRVRPEPRNGGGSPSPKRFGEKMWTGGGPVDQALVLRVIDGLRKL